jgi:2-oxoglutarate ferredoxin oxidoreductase subunit beta
MVDLKDYKGGPTAWCPGCGNFGILSALKNALVKLDKKPEEVLIISGIGQSGKLPHYMRVNTFNGLHGRTLPPATGAKLANHGLTVIAIGGDGDT